MNGITFNESVARAVRPIGKANDSDYRMTTPLADAADKNAASKTDKSGLTVSLTHYTPMAGSYKDGRTAVTSGAVNSTIFRKIGELKLGESVIFNTPEVKEALKTKSYDQDEVFNEHVSKDGGVKYAKKGDNFYESALSLAEANNRSISEPYRAKSLSIFRTNKLNLDEINSSLDKSDHLSAENMEDIDLDGNPKKVSISESAAYLLTADANKDGVISKEESNNFMIKEPNKIKSEAKDLYDYCKYYEDKR